MKPYRKDHLLNIQTYRELAADWAQFALNERLMAMATGAGASADEAAHRRHAVLACSASESARSWADSARELYDEFLERERTNNWLRAE